MTTLPSMGLVLPTRGAAGAGAWDDTIDADLGLVDAHDHTPGKGEMIPVAALSIDDDVSFSGAYAPINLHRLTFASVTALSTNNKSLFVSSSDNELYWRSNAGANVKITNGAALNVAAFTGGFGAGYSSAGAVADYDSSTTRYTFKTGTGTWARAAFGGIRLYEHGTSAATYVELLSPASLASTYSVTFPAALPASTAVVQMSSAGALSTTTAPTLTALTVTGASSLAATTVLGRTNISSSAAEGDTGPALVASGGGKRRTFLDHLGFLGGNLTTYEEVWKGAPGTNSSSGTFNMPTGWTSTVVSPASGTITDPTSLFPQRHMLMTATDPGSAVPSSYVIFSDYMHWLTNSSAVVFSVSLASPSGIPNLYPTVQPRISAGLQFSGTNNYIGWSYFDDGTALASNYHVAGLPGVVASSSSGASTYTGAADEVVRIRIEIIGSSITGLTAGTYRVRFFVNGETKATHTFTSDPGSDKFRLRFSSENTNGGTTLRVGAIRLLYNHQLDSDVY